MGGQVPEITYFQSLSFLFGDVCVEITQMTVILIKTQKIEIKQKKLFASQM